MTVIRYLKNVIPGAGARAGQEVTRHADWACLAPGNQWYSPVTFGPSSLLKDVSGGGTAREVLRILEQLTPDQYIDFVGKFYRAALDRFGDEWIYADITTVLFGVTRRLPIRDYLEIGVRRGRSMAMVAVHSPDCRITGFDMWIEDYAGMDNPGPPAVREELARLGFRGSLEFVNGDSAKTVPAYFAANPERFFDLITVDGDHSVAGAKTDLLNVIPRLKIGGILVFDDVCNPDHPGLAETWEEVVGRDCRFASYSFTEAGFGVAFAVRQR